MKVFFRYMTVSKFLLLAVFLFCVVSPTAAQYRVRSFLLKQNYQTSSLFASSQDSLLTGDTIRVTESSKSPGLAILLSAVLPGAGQIYTKRYWTVPIILGFGGYFVSQWIRANDLYLSARIKYKQSVEAGENDGKGNAQLLHNRDFYRDERDRFAFYIAITYLLNIVDAYVGASLYDFEVSDNLGGAAVKVSIPIR